MKKIFFLLLCATILLLISCKNEEPQIKGGKFSVSATQQVIFSQGNLQYIQDGSKSSWQFATNQTDYIGKENIKDGKINTTIDLFGWSTESTHFGISTSSNNSTYSGQFIDWGTQIGEGWYTLSQEEWQYLLFHRQNAKVLYAIGTVNGTNGLILLPDDWKLPEGITFNSGVATGYGGTYYKTKNEYSASQWGQMEHEGAIFLPAAENRDGTTAHYGEWGGYYWSSSEYGIGGASCLTFCSNQVMVSANGTHYGQSVRLVKAIK